MIPVFIASVTPFSGKHTLSLGLAKKFMDEGLKVGYFKPIGLSPRRQNEILLDEDTIFFKAALKLEEGFEEICPTVVTDEMLSQAFRGVLSGLREKTLEAYERVSQGKDIMIICGAGRLSSGSIFGYPASAFIKDVQAKTVVAEQFRYRLEALDGLLHAQGVLGELLIGVVFNRILKGKRSQIDNAVRPFLQSHGIDVLGIIPQDKVLGAVSLADMVEAINGQMLVGESEQDILIERFSIGAMNVDAALRHFRHVRNKTVITGGDRADIQLAALETSTTCLILTGDLYPNERILAKAEELGVPVVLTPYDTLKTVEQCERLAGHMSLRSAKKIRRAAELVAESIDFDMLNARLGLK